MTAEESITLLLAEDRLLTQPIESFLWRKPTLKLGEAVAIYDSTETSPLNDAGKA
jgi:hypothetical protein